MEHRQIASLSVSVVGLGCNNFGSGLDLEQTKKVVFAALDHNINYFDTADFYGGFQSEELLGQALSGVREEVIVASKFGHSMSNPDRGAGGDPRWVKKSLDDSLRRLNTDYIDHYQMHLPDEQTPLEDTLGVLEEAKAAGKVRVLGCSNFDANLLDAAQGRFASVQNHYSLLTREPQADVLAACERDGVAFVPYFPLESGLLTGKYTSTEPPAGTRLANWGDQMKDMFLTEASVAAAQRLADYAKGKDRTLLQLAMSWLASQPQVASVIAGATKPEQVRANAAAVDWNMTPEEIAEAAEVAAG